MTVLEENGGGNGNSSVAELEVRVETLEGTAADHETRISTTESDIEGEFIVSVFLMLPLVLSSITILPFFTSLDLEGTVADQETRLTAAEENIQG